MYVFTARIFQSSNKLRTRLDWIPCILKIFLRSEFRVHVSYDITETCLPQN